MEFGKKLAFWRRREEFEAGLAGEMEFHIAERADELEREGLPPKEALRRARVEFGSRSTIAEDSRRAWQFGWLEDLFADLRYAARAFLREPGFFLAAVASLALGVGVNTAIFSLTLEALFSVPSVRSPETVVYARLGGGSHISQARLHFVRTAGAFSWVGGLAEEGELNWRNGDETRRLFAVRVTDEFFASAGIPVAMGRGLLPGETDAIVVSWRLWSGRLGADPAILGRVLALDGKPRRIVGVLPEDHRTLIGFGFAPDLYTLLTDPRANVQMYVRLPESASPETARERLRVIGQALDREMPETHYKFAENVEARPAASNRKSRVDNPLNLFFLLLMTVVTLLLAIACLNVSGLLLARSSSRRHELAVRASLGAGSGRLLRQLLAETLLLSAGGTAAGLVLHQTIAAMVRGFELPLPLPVQLRMDPDWRVFLYAAGIAIVCTLAAGLLPAWRASRARNAEALHQGERALGGRQRLRKALVVVQVAVSLVILTTSVLFARNFYASLATNTGMDLDRTLYVSLRLVPENYPTAEGRMAIANRAILAFRAIPGVEAAAWTKLIPFNDNATHGGTVDAGLGGGATHIARYANRVGPDYFRVAGIPLVAGREFIPTDDETALVVNESFARAAGGTAPLAGRTIHLGEVPRTVVGVVRDSCYAWLSDTNRPAAFEPFRMREGTGREPILNILVRGAVDPESLVRPLQFAAMRLDPSAGVEVKPMRRAMGMALLPSRMGALLLGSMGVLGLLLTGIGLYGLVAYSVARRVREIGLRVALGATPSGVRRMVLLEGATLVGIGLAIGLVAALFVTRPLAQFLVEGLSPSDPLTYVAVVLLLCAAGGLACLVPVRRALRIEPMEALRHD